MDLIFECVAPHVAVTGRQMNLAGESQSSPPARRTRDQVPSSM